MSEKAKVLVVDDDRQMVKTICDILRVRGYEASPAYCGEEAVELVRGDDPCCVLMDIRMPGINGIEALKMIKEDAPDLPVLLMSAYATGEQTEEAIRAGAYTVLAKPVDIRLLLSFLSLRTREESILVVDDDPLFCDSLSDILQARGYRVETAGDAGRLLGQMEQEYRLAVILGRRLGNVSGEDVLKSIRQEYPGKPVILINCNEGEPAESNGSGPVIGAYACLRRPVDPEMLIGIIEEISRRKFRQLLGERF